jgi:hypothetical protein
MLRHCSRNGGGYTFRYADFERCIVDRTLQNVKVVKQQLDL